MKFMKFQKTHFRKTFFGNVTNVKLENINEVWYGRARRTSNKERREAEGGANAAPQLKNTTKVDHQKKKNPNSHENTETLR